MKQILPNLKLNSLGRVINVLAAILTTTVTEAQRVDIGVATNVSQTQATLSAFFAEGSSENGFQFKYGTLTERTGLATTLLTAKSDPVTLISTGDGGFYWREAREWAENATGLQAGQYAQISFTANFTEASPLIYEWCTDAENDKCIFELLLDGKTTGIAAQGLQNTPNHPEFVKENYTIPEGEHTIAWRFSKIADTNTGSDLAFLRNVTICNTTPGTWLNRTATSTSLRVEGLYPQQNYLFRAYSTLEGEKVYSPIAQMRTDSVEIGHVEITGVTQTSTTVIGHFSTGDAPTYKYVRLWKDLSEYWDSGYSTTSIRGSFLETSSVKPERIYCDMGQYENYIRTSSGSDDLNITFTLDHDGEISFDWEVKGVITNADSDKPFASAYVRVDGIEMKRLSATSNIDFAKETVRLKLNKGQHTVEWKGNFPYKKTYPGSSVRYYGEARFSKLHIHSGQDIALPKATNKHTFTGLIPNTTYVAQTVLEPAPAQVKANGMLIFNYDADLEVRWPQYYSDHILIKTRNAIATAKDVTNLRQCSATLNGYYDGGDATIVAQGFQYKTANAATWSDIPVGTSGNVSANLSRLRHNTIYDYRCYIQAQGCDTAFSDTAHFKTKNVIPHAPTAECTQHSAKLTGAVDFGDAIIYTRGLQHRAAGQTDWTTYEDTGHDSTFTKTIGQLDINAPYEARTYVQPQGGDTIYSLTMAYQTKNVAVNIDTITDITYTSATVIGSIQNVDDQTKALNIHVYKEEEEVACISPDIKGNTFTIPLTDLVPGETYKVYATIYNSKGEEVTSAIAEEVPLDTLAQSFVTYTEVPIQTSTQGWLSAQGEAFCLNAFQKTLILDLTLKESTTLSFDWSVTGTGHTQTSSGASVSVSFEVDGSSKEHISTWRNSLKKESVSLSLPAGRHTLKWITKTSGIAATNYKATVSNLQCGTPKTTLELADTFTTKPIISAAPKTTSVTQTTATVTTTLAVHSDTLDDYGYYYQPGTDINKNRQKVSLKESGSEFTLKLNELYPQTYYTCQAYYVIGGKEFMIVPFLTIQTLKVESYLQILEQYRTSIRVKTGLNKGDAEVSHVQYRDFSLPEPTPPVTPDNQEEYEKWLDKYYYKDLTGEEIEFSGLEPCTQYGLSIRFWVKDRVYYTYQNLQTACSYCYKPYEGDTGQTYAKAHFKYDISDAALVECGIILESSGDTIHGIAENGLATVVFNNLQPGSHISYRVKSYVRTDDGEISHSTMKELNFTTSTITVATQPATNISNRSAQFNGTVTCDTYSDAQIGFEWKGMGEDWLSDAVFTPGVCLEDGTLKLGITNGILEPNKDYEYRTVVKYQGMAYCGEWTNFRTESEYIFYPATVYTVYRTDRTNNQIILCGQYISGSEDVIERGYEYWPNTLTQQIKRSTNTSGKKTRITCDTSMRYVLNTGNMDEGTYDIRAYVRTESGYFYGKTLSFNVGNVTGTYAPQVDAPPVICRPVRGGIEVSAPTGTPVAVYAMSGQLVHNERMKGNNVVTTISLPRNAYIVRVKDQSFKVIVK